MRDLIGFVRTQSRRIREDFAENSAPWIQFLFIAYVMLVCAVTFLVK